MIWMMRNISIRLWLTTLIATPFVFYVLPVLNRSFPGINPSLVSFLTIVCVIGILEFLMNRLACRAVIGLIKDGQAWERSGISNRAEKKYIKAVRMYDTFLLWPFSAKKIVWLISGTIAKFKLNTDSDNQNFNLGTAVYLKMNPEDEDIVQSWLVKLRQSTIVTPFEQEILSLLAERYGHQPVFSKLMADIFIRLERRDFTAKKIYLRIQKDPGLAEKYSKTIERLVGQPDEMIQGDITSFQSFMPPQRKTEATGQIRAAAPLVGSVLKRLWAEIRTVLKYGLQLPGKGAEYIKQNAQVRFYLKTGLICVFLAWFMFFMVGTLSHMFKSKPLETKKKLIIEIQVPKPFTIQVAAYLKLKHAESYVDTLKKKGIDAAIKKVDGGGKTWFVVRVSRFTDKQSAAAYGQKLKDQQVIDDFFVNNR